MTTQSNEQVVTVHPDAAVTNKMYGIGYVTLPPCQPPGFRVLCRMVKEARAVSHAVSKMDVMVLCTKYGVPVSGGIIRSIRASGGHTPGEAVVSVVAHPADGSSA
ncbi:hypothetical protein V8C34DRAFT_278671 [Trichoderma compactum]